MTIGLDEASITGSIKQDIKLLIEKIIPETKGCDDCIKIEKMKFQSSKKDNKLKQLENQIAELEKYKRASDLAADSMRLNNLENQLTDAQNARNALQTMAHRRELQELEEDSVRLALLLQAERDRKMQDSVRFVNTEQRLKRVMDSKIKSDSIIISETMGIVKQQVSDNKKDRGSFLGMQTDDGGSGIMNSIFFIFLIVCLMVVTFLAASNRKPKTIYLKPKTNMG